MIIKIKVACLFNQKNSISMPAFYVLSATGIKFTLEHAIQAHRGNTDIALIKVFSPTDAQLDSLKNNIKFLLKLTLKTPTYFSVKHHLQGMYHLSLAKVTIVKMS